MNQFNNAKEIRCSGGVAVPVNPYKIMSVKRPPLPFDQDDAIDNNSLHDQFKTWLSQQPTLYCDESLNGIYPVGEFGEVVWQWNTGKIWRDERPKEYKIYKDYTEYSSFMKTHAFTTRLFLKHLGPKNQEREECVYSPGNDNYGRDKPFYDEPATRQNHLCFRC